jgi:hypothetical protein
MQMAYNFDKEMVVGNWEVKVDSGAMYGYFENCNSGNGGGLWLEAKADVLDEAYLTLRDYDGTYCLPKQVSAALIMLGFFVDTSFQ